VIAVGSLFLHLISWNFVLSGLIFICSGVFQALGNTLPSLLSSAIRLVTYVVPVAWLTTQSNYQLEHVWYLSIATAALQAVISVALLRRQMRLQLGSPGATTQPA
jgi:Na+-driven multidrug efflux pump